MAHDYNEEMFDVNEIDAEESVGVRFTNKGGQVKGRVVADVRGKSRTKIVFMARGWIGDLPRDGEELIVRVVHETKIQSPGLGVLFVKRVLPKVDRRNYRGALCAECRSCGEYRVQVIRLGTTRFQRESYPVCEACGTIHELDPYWK